MCIGLWSQDLPHISRSDFFLSQDGLAEQLAQVAGDPLVHLAGDRVAIRGIELDGTGIADAGTLPATSELMVSATEDGRRWRLEEAALVAGDGTRLPRLPAHRAFWFGWLSAYPHTRLVR